MTPPDDSSEIEVSAADEAFVSSLLRGLPPLTMPADAAARLDAVLEELQGFDGEAAGDHASATAAPTSNVTPISAAKRPRTVISRSTRFMQVAAISAGVLAVSAITVGMLQHHRSSSGQGTPATAAAGATTHGLTAATKTTASGTAYTDANLNADALMLVSSESRQKSSASASSTNPEPAPLATTAAGSPEFTGVLPQGLSARVAASLGVFQRLITNTAAFDSCISGLEDPSAPYQRPIAIDAGTYKAQPALVIVLPGLAVQTYAVYVVGPECSSTDAAVLSYHAVPVPVSGQ